MLIITNEHYKELKAKDTTTVCGCFEPGTVASLAEEQKKYGYIEVGDIKAAKSTDPNEEVCFAIITNQTTENLLFEDEPSKTTLTLKRITALGTLETLKKNNSTQLAITA